MRSRYAVLALDRWTQLTQREIGGRLGMTTAQVAKVLGRNRSTKASPICEWLTMLDKLAARIGMDNRDFWIRGGADRHDHLSAPPPSPPESRIRSSSR